MTGKPQYQKGHSIILQFLDNINNKESLVQWFTLSASIITIDLHLREGWDWESTK